MGFKMRQRLSILTHTVIALGLSSGIGIADPSAKILADAKSYTAHIEVSGSIALNQDDGKSGQATAFLIDKERGWLLTNAHVARRSPVSMWVSFEKGNSIEATRVFVDSLLDIAIIKVAPEEIDPGRKEAKLDCGPLPEPGLPITVLGHPNGLKYTFTSGVVTNIRWFDPEEFVETNAAINPGNSGGPVIDEASGLVVAISAQSYKPDDDRSLYVPLSVPSLHVCPIVELLKAGANAQYRQLPVSIANHDQTDLPVVGDVYEKSSGFQTGDIILGIEGSPNVRNYADLATQMRGKDQVLLGVRRDGEFITINARPIPQPDVLKARAINFGGLVISEPWKLDRAEFAHQSMFVITDILTDTDAWFTDASIGSGILAVNNQRLGTIDELFAYLEKVREGDDVQFFMKAISDDKRFFRQGHIITLQKRDLEWIEPN